MRYELLGAIQRGDVRSVRCAIKKKGFAIDTILDSQAEGGHGGTALMWASFYEKLEIVRLLLDALHVRGHGLRRIELRGDAEGHAAPGPARALRHLSFPSARENGLLLVRVFMRRMPVARTHATTLLRKGATWLLRQAHHGRYARGQRIPEPEKRRSACLNPLIGKALC